MTLTEIGERISVHLARFEADPKINVSKNPGGIKPYYRAWAGRTGRYLSIAYVCFQCTHKLTKDQAEAYLRWLDDGNVGRHHTALSFNARVESVQKTKQ